MISPDVSVVSKLYKICVDCFFDTLLKSKWIVKIDARQEVGNIVFCEPILNEVNTY